MSSAAPRQSPVEIRKRVVRHALCMVLKSLLPTQAPSNSTAARPINTEVGTLISINTSKLRLLHVRANHTVRVGNPTIPEFLQSKDLDTVAMGRYIQRVMKPAREIAFHFLFSDEEVSLLVNNQVLTEENCPTPTTWTEFFIVLCPLDFLVGAHTRGAADAVPYHVNTAYGTNGKILAYLKEHATSDDCLDRVTRSYLQVGDYQRTVGVSGKDRNAVCQLSMTRKSDFMDVMINMFCQVTRIYDGGESQAHGFLFGDQLAMMNRRLLDLTAARAFHRIATTDTSSHGASMCPDMTRGGGGGGPVAAATAAEYKRPVHPRQRTLVIRASLDQLNDEAAADAYATAAKLFFELIRSQDRRSGKQPGAGGGEDARRAIESYTTALTQDGFVVGMVNVFVDEAHESLVILDTYVHPAMARKIYVMDAMVDTLRLLIADEGVKHVVVLEPIRMNRELVLPVIETLVRAAGPATVAPPPTDHTHAHKGTFPSNYGTPVFAEWNV